MNAPSSLIQQDSIYQLENIQYYHTSGGYQSHVPGDPFSALENDMMYLPEVVTQSNLAVEE